METQWDRVARWARMGNNRASAQAATTDEVNTEETTEEGTMAQGEGLEDLVEPEIVSGAAAEAGAEIGGAAAELEAARAERDGYRDRLARLQAEFDNARKREAKERLTTRADAISDAVEPFLGVMDNFQLALRSEGTAEQLRSGVELILKQMEDALRGLQVQAVETVGTEFDPRVHEALGSIETKEFPDHQVMEEVRRGYRLRDKLLRPALVRIAANPAQVDA